MDRPERATVTLASHYSGPLPTRVVHADWSIDPRKRWMAQAVLTEKNRYIAYPPERVGNLESFLPGLNQAAGAGDSILIGFDFPIGLPFAYAQAANLSRFLDLLPRLGSGEWQDFFEVAAEPQQINIHRPFYPKRPGSTRREHLEAALNLEFHQLFRHCECKSDFRRAACPLFWTLGGQQVGKAALNGWQMVLIPGLNNISLNLRLWPFHGPLSDLLQPGQLVVVETYPSEFYHQLVLSFPRRRGTRGGKRSQTGREANSPRLLAWTEETGVQLEPGLEECIQDGFGSAPAGEDPFDAIVGLFGMLNLVLGYHLLYEPQEISQREIEGWIFGQVRRDVGEAAVILRK